MKYLVKAPAKVNICLKVNGKMEDGYHDLKMIMYSISLYDKIEYEVKKAKKSEKVDKSKQISLKCNFAYIPTDERNLIVKIVRYIFDKYDIHDMIFINLIKMIPTSAGLGGGSSDAAATLLFLNRFYKLKLSMDELVKIATSFGSDIPFFLYKKQSFLEGRGEKVSSIPQFKNFYILIATPDARVSTKDIYNMYDEVPLDKSRDADNSEKLEKLMYALEKRDLEILCPNLFNDLELVTTKMIPDIDIFKKEMIEYGASASLMSGSGPTVFGIFTSFLKAIRCKDILKRKHPESFVFVSKPL